MGPQSAAPPTRSRVANLDELKPDIPKVFEVEGEEVMVVRSGERVYAIANLCSHAEAYLDMGIFHADSLEIECPLHVGRFDVRTGAATVAPCVVPVRAYDVVVDGSEVLLAPMDAY
uniref:Ferredoxin component of carbazole 1,9a-dioxygenase n=1 Tax=Janibacter sp. OC11 TaxID=1450653 RepID=W6JN99_9MICO|nr:ferredoxin component of carbazole 1,9a-dioxygenase [Janibacter sp. OC11]